MNLWSRTRSYAPRDVQKDPLYTVETGTSHHITRPCIENAGVGRQLGRSYVGETGATPPTERTCGQTGSDRPSGKTHLGEIGVFRHDGSVQLGETGACRHPRFVGVEQPGASHQKVLVSLGETGASRHNRSVHLGQTGACHNKLIPLRETVFFCSTGKPHLGGTRNICPT